MEKMTVVKETNALGEKFLPKIIFLDIDGVLTSVDDGTSYLDLKPENYRISEHCFGLLKDLIAKTDAYVIISSNWRRFPDDGYFTFQGKQYQNQLPKLKEMLGKRYLGDIPHERHITKSAGIILWAEDNDINLNDGSFDYVIFDDCHYEMDDASQMMRKHFVHCDEEHGLTEIAVERAVKILNG